MSAPARRRRARCCRRCERRTSEVVDDPRRRQLRPAAGAGVRGRRLRGRACSSKRSGSPRLPSAPTGSAPRLAAASGSSSATCSATRAWRRSFQISTLGGSFSWKNTAAQVSYMNKTNRWNWGLVGGQVPYLSGGVRASIDVVNGVPAYIEQTILLARPNCSGGGRRRLSVQSRAPRRVPGRREPDRVRRDHRHRGIRSCGAAACSSGTTQEQSVADTLHLGTASAALVFDTSIFGATSPVGGQRYRLEVAPTFGEHQLRQPARRLPPLLHAGALLHDCATRVLHYGRYGSGGEDAASYPLYIGYPSLVRGYDVNTLDASECVSAALNGCPAFDRLMGSRMLVANLEFRFPLLRPFGASPADVWTVAGRGGALRRRRRRVEPAHHTEPVRRQALKASSSVGAAFRVNLLGFAVGEFDFSHPLQRATRTGCSSSTCRRGSRGQEGRVGR